MFIWTFLVTKTSCSYALKSWNTLYIYICIYSVRCEIQCFLLGCGWKGSNFTYSLLAYPVVITTVTWGVLINFGDVIRKQKVRKLKKCGKPQLNRAIFTLQELLQRGARLWQYKTGWKENISFFASTYGRTDGRTNAMCDYELTSSIIFYTAQYLYSVHSGS